MQTLDELAIEMAPEVQRPDLAETGQKTRRTIGLSSQLDHLNQRRHAVFAVIL